MPTETILQQPFFQGIVLPFLLVFTLIFAILEKIKILGEDKKQVNAIISLVIGLIFVSFSSSVQFTTNILGITAVIAVVILAFLLLYGFSSGDKEFSMPSGVKITLGILVSLALAIAILFYTGSLDKISEAVTGGNPIIGDVIFIAFIIGAIVMVMKAGGKKE